MNKLSMDETIRGDGHDTTKADQAPLSPVGTPLDASPPQEPFVDGMALGSGINAMTGELLGSPFVTSSIQELEVVSKDSSEWLDRKIVRSSKELKRCVDLSSLSSFAVPLHGLDLSLKSGFDFFDENTSNMECTLIILTWERNFKSKRLAEGAKFSEEACKLLNESPETFRDHYGDYFVYEIFCKARIVAMWKCTSEDESSMTKFRIEMESSLKIPGNIVEGSSSFDGFIRTSAKASSVSIQVEVSRQGDLSDVDANNPDDIDSLFKSFCTKAKPSFTNVLLRHYHQIFPSVPTTINMDPELFIQLCDVFSDAKKALLLNSMTADKQKIDRHDQITRIFKQIHASRRRYQSNEDLLRTSIQRLTDTLDSVKAILRRQELITELRGYGVDDLRRQVLGLPPPEQENEKSPATPDKEKNKDDDDGNYVQSILGRNQFIIGRTQFTQKEREILGVKTVDWNMEGFHLQVKAGPRPFRVHEGSLVFPQSPDDYGNIVGIAIHDMRKDGQNGYWEFPKQNPLGTKSVCIKFKGKHFRSFDWALSVAYIPTALFDD
ncbi:hypothetical protein SCHPADRAFT_886518 [Schizopora paradoxa]|uniref:Uncharacterized protein n=1 Tax=Schizopora paradoxa TaxID=27342 RepID=A0A0H2S162_9AGAM|nr:hypothetical protein SCHPADRAFT_886518 [Schizopora paradoxa]